MIQLVREPDGVESSLPQAPENPSEQLPLLFPEEFDETDAPIHLHRGRLMLFIDGANLFYAASQMGVEIDYAKLLNYLQQQSTLIYAFFYTGVDPSNLRQHAFLTWMRRNGYRVVTKDVVLNPSGSKRVSSMNVEIAVDMMRFAQDCDTEILISGDGDLAYAVNAVSHVGTKVEVISLRSMTHDRLVAVADNFIDILSLRDAIQKSPRS
ncbi:LabA-like NYN domain-containing protein [Leptolyngbya sp. GGD]|uniref:LabA-like NYN domain-containing protein n=1 Tax=Leptolyngbya sp. GGD TaxID=2997907 RepID=UPI00227B9798|nr:NYN domain-containing protein [Leptolyngbya sp. GGD]MCY6494467.1 NYN domain-containing protein [Leptolyngbya sp. GGD]